MPAVLQWHVEQCAPSGINLWTARAAQAKALNSPTMSGGGGKGGFREFNFPHNWPYSTPLNAKEMVCGARLL